jgi:Trypsin-like peptidase domain/Effector-associated domain 1
MSTDWQPSGRWKQKFRQALSAAFNAQSLELLTSDYLPPSLRFSNVAPPGLGTTFDYQIQQLIEQSRMDDLLVELVAAAHERRPRSAKLAAIAEERGFTPTGPRLDNPTGTPLEALIQKHAQFINFTNFLEGLQTLQGQVCFIDVPQGGGTGFLVAKDLVLTNQHVVEPITRNTVSRKDVRCRFDYRQTSDGVPVAAGRQTDVELLDTDQWLVDSTPPSAADWNPALGDAGPGELDYALIRLADAVGEEPIGGPTADPLAEPRGWITAPEPAPQLVGGNQMFMLQHPNREPLQLAIGSVSEFNASGTRVRHTANSKDGSSGSPCLNADLQLVALHHAHDTAYPPQWNQAVPFSLIRQAWKDRGVAVV